MNMSFHNTRVNRTHEKRVVLEENQHSKGHMPCEEEDAGQGGNLGEMDEGWVDVRR